MAETSPKLAKKPRKNFSKKALKELAENLKNGEAPMELANKFGVSANCIRGNKRNLKDLEKKLATPDVSDVNKSWKKPKLEILDKAMNYWFLQTRRQHIPITIRMIQLKARKLASKIYPEIDFKGSVGYATRFLDRHDFRRKKICCEKVFSDIDSAIKFKKEFRHMLEKEGWHPAQIYNCDESGLLYKETTKYTYAPRTERCPPGKCPQ